MGERILVTTEYLKEKEEEWKELLGLAQNAYQEAAKSADKLEEYFSCKETAVIRKKFAVWKEEGMDVFERLKSHLGKLKSMALIYEEAERSNVNVTVPN
ncbi:hypothetical protein [Parablautia muri]|uniref:hypothetical protein n=1 Tax=Parablautia muri TaxID=2320879 RepID=UPI0013698F6A|nr:hypothetical protein [Parablautia muri]